ncbi:MAG: hypothetical protein GX614_10410 [Sandaracinaceae bacterium]|nr:hypothetical protein [Sandaracinaceae bacterium]
MRKRRALELIEEMRRPGKALRHPDDGYPIAPPYPVGPKTERAIRSVMRVLLPEGDAPRNPELDERVYRQMLVSLQYMSKSTAQGILSVFHLLEWIPVTRFGRPSRLSKLSRDEGSEIFRAIESSPLLPVRLLLLAPKALIFSSYFDQPEVHEALGYEPRKFTLDRIALRQRIIEHGDADEEDEIHHTEALR